MRILTARPTAGEERRLPHRLYGIRSAAEAGSVAWWRQAALVAMSEARDAGRRPILTGGSGLYFAALTDGLAEIADPGPAARAEARRLLAEQGPAALHASLTQRRSRHRRTPEARRQPAYRPCVGGVAWHRSRPCRVAETERGAPAPWRFAAILLDPPRDALRAAIAARFDAMLRQGALEEVRDLLALNLDPALPAMRAHGVPELSAHLRGALSLDEARRRTELVTGSIHQAPGNLVSPSQSCSPDPHFRNSCAIFQLRAIFGK